MVCLRDNDTAVRSKAAAALGHILTHVDVVKAVTRYQSTRPFLPGTSEKPGIKAENVDGYEEYWNNICDLLIDKDDQSAGSAFQAVEFLMCAARDQNNADAGSPWTVLLQRWAEKCFQRLFANLAAILHRARRLDCAGTVSSACRITLAQSPKTRLPRSESSSKWGRKPLKERTSLQNPKQCRGLYLPSALCWRKICLRSIPPSSTSRLKGSSK